MGDQGNASSSSSCRGRRVPAGFGLALARVVRRLRRRSKMLLCTAAPATSSRCSQYDPLSYARNFDGDGFGTALDNDVSGASHLCHHYTFASRFVLASSSSVRQPQ